MISQSVTEDARWNEGVQTKSLKQSGETRAAKIQSNMRTLLIVPRDLYAIGLTINRKAKDCYFSKYFIVVGT